MTTQERLHVMYNTNTDGLELHRCKKSDVEMGAWRAGCLLFYIGVL